MLVEGEDSMNYLKKIFQDIYEGYIAVDELFAA